MRGARLRHVVPPARARAALFAVVAAMLCACVLAFVPAPAANAATAAATQNSETQFNLPFAAPAIGKDEKMLVESDQMVYDYDHNSVAAVGNVKIYYAGYTLQAAKVSYNKTSGRLIATGNVQLVDPSGSAIYSEYVDITDNFRDGFVQSLRVDTPQRTHFAAERAERSGGITTTFINGNYTACTPCLEHPEKPPLWQVKAAKIVVNHQDHMVFFTEAQIEFFGQPIATLPYFSIPDPSVTRKSGFLVPSAGYTGRVGGYASVPYYWALAPSYDLTLAPTVFSRQGLLVDGEWRQRLANGEYTIDAAGIYQLDPDAFIAGSPANRTLRGGVRTTGALAITRDWTLGWDGTLSTDREFTRDYGVLTASTDITPSTIYLTGIGKRDYFQASASYFQVLTDQSSPTVANPSQYDQGRQGLVAPVIDYNRVGDNEFLGGPVTYTSNIANVVRTADDPYPFLVGPNQYYDATAGNTVRATQEVDWQRRFVGPMGQVITPFASLRGDAFFLDGTSDATSTDGLIVNSTVVRFMPAVGVDWSLPILATTPHATHIIEPIAQLIVRPDETDAGLLPNNDAQSLVFDASNLFEHDKFSGFDRVEGGTRANLGIHYNGTFASGATLDGTIGESIQLSGLNSFATDPVSGVGIDSGLQNTFSDYVAGMALNTGLGPQFSANTRFASADLNLNRAEIQATTALGPVTTSASYLYLRQNPLNLATSASVVRGAASVNLSENWRAFGTMTYDITGADLAGDSFGIAFDNDCLTLSVAYSQSIVTDQPNEWLNFRLALRTLGSGSVTSNIGNLTN
jgi:LPS-assembly protein